MAESEGPKVSRKNLFRLGAAALGAAFGVVAVAAKPAPQSVTVENKPKPVEQKSFENGFATARELLGEGYKVTRLDVEGIDPSQEPPMIFDVKSKGSGFEGLDEKTEQKGFYYLAGAPRDSFPRGASVSMQVSLMESQDGTKRYIVFGIDNATGPTEARKFSPDNVSYEVTTPTPPVGGKRPESQVGKPFSQKEVEERGGTLTSFAPDKPQLQGEKVKNWEQKGAMFFFSLGDTKLVEASNVTGGSPDFLPTRISLKMQDSQQNRSVSFTAIKRPAK